MHTLHRMGPSLRPEAKALNLGHRSAQMRTSRRDPPRQRFRQQGAWVPSDGFAASSSTERCELMRRESPGGCGVKAIEQVGETLNYRVVVIALLARGKALWVIRREVCRGWPLSVDSVPKGHGKKDWRQSRNIPVSSLSGQASAARQIFFFHSPRRASTKTKACKLRAIRSVRLRSMRHETHAAWPAFNKNAAINGQKTRRRRNGSVATSLRRHGQIGVHTIALHYVFTEEKQPQKKKHRSLFKGPSKAARCSPTRE